MTNANLQVETSCTVTDTGKSLLRPHSFVLFALCRQLLSLSTFYRLYWEKHSTEKDVLQEFLYLAVVQGGYKLIGSKWQLRPLVEVHSPAHVVKVLEIEDRHYGGISVHSIFIMITSSCVMLLCNSFHCHFTCCLSPSLTRVTVPSLTQLQKPHWYRRPPSINCMYGHM